MKPHRFYSLATAIAVSPDPVADAVAAGLHFILGRQALDGTWGGSDRLNRLIATTHAVMALQAVGFRADSEVLRRSLEYLRGIDRDTNVNFYYRSGAFLNVPGFEREVEEDVQYMWRYRDRIGAHPNYPAPFFLLKLLRFRHNPPTGSVSVDRVLRWVLEQWDDKDCWYRQPAITSMAVALIFDLRFPRKATILRRATRFVADHFRLQPSGEHEYAERLVENCFFLFNVCERNLTAEPFAKSLAPIVRANADRVFAAHRPDGSWDGRAVFGGITETSVYTTANAVRALLAVHARGQPEFVSAVSASLVTRSAIERPAREAGLGIDDIREPLRQFRKDHPDMAQCGFVMMRFTRTDQHREIYEAVKHACNRHGLVAARADEKDYTDELLPNIRTYMHGCGFGVAVFERLESDEFNPNISLEVGYMLAQGKKVCLLKDKRLPKLPTDLVGRLYREFDSYAATTSIVSALEGWICNYEISGHGVAGIPTRLLPPQSSKRRRRVKR